MTYNQIGFVINTLLKSLLIMLTASFLISGLLQIPSSTTQARQKPEGTSGTLTLDGKAFKLRHIRARKRVDFWDEKKHTISLLFTEQPLLNRDSESLEQLRQMVKAGRTEVLEIDIDEKQKVISTTVWSLGSMVLKPGYSIQIVASTEKVIDGRFNTNEALDFLGHKLEFDVTFKAPVELDVEHSPVSPRTGKRLPPGGGEPGKAYLDYVNAESAKVRDKLKEWSKNPPPNVTPEYITRMKEQEETTTVKVTGGLIEGDRATLDVIIDLAASGEEERAKVNLLFRTGRWEVIHDDRSERTQKRSIRKER